MPIIDEYLVKLGAVVDQSGMTSFQNALREATQSVKANALAMTGAFFKAQTEIVGAFATIGTAALGLADKVAMADQDFRLFAMHMYMSKDAARSLKMAMDALGQPLENLAWDTELRKRTSQLITDQRAMAPNGDYEEQLHKIRDIRFELTRTEVAIQYLGMHVVQDFMKALGLGPDILLAKLHQFSNWLVHDLPEISDKLVHWFLPIWRDIKEVFERTSDAMLDVGRAFGDVVGTLTDDSTIKNANTDFDKFGATIQKLSHIFAVFAETLADVVDLLAKIISALVHVTTLNFSAAWNDVKAMRKDVNARTIGAAVLVGTTMMGAPEVGVEAETALAGGEAAAAGGAALAEDLTAEEMAMMAEEKGMTAEDFAGINAERAAARRAAMLRTSRYGKMRTALAKKATVAKDWRTYAGWGKKHPLITSGLGANIGDSFNSTTGLTMDTVSPEIMQALWNAESGNSDTAQNPTSSAYGPGQLLNATARSLGVDKYDPAQNRAGSTALMNEALRYAHGDLPLAIATYHEGQPKMDAILAGRATLSEGAKYDVSRTLGGIGRTGDVSVGGITIHITQLPGENAEHVARRTAAETTKQFQDLVGKQSQRNQQSFGQVAWSY